MAAKYSVELSRDAAKTIRNLDRITQRRLVAKLHELAEYPRPPNVKKLVGDADAWRVRVGDFRIVYEIHDRKLLILVLDIGHRREVYR
jgi:mRNA interferase RelE/StbE